MCYSEANKCCTESKKCCSQADICQGIQDTAAAIVDQLADNGVTAETLVDQQKKVDDYGKVNGKPQATRSNGRAARGMEAREFAAIERLLKRQLDGLMSPFKLTQPEFYAAYFAARDIIDLPGGHKGKNGSSGNHETPTPPTT